MRALLFGILLLACFPVGAPVAAQTKLSDLVGVWQGHFTCRAGKMGGQMVITPEGAKTARAEFEYVPLTDRQKRHAGNYSIIQYRIEIDADTRKVRFIPVDWIHGGKRMRLIPIEATINSVDGSMSGAMKADGCGEFEVRRADYKTLGIGAIQQRPIELADLVGTWDGHFQCRLGKMGGTLAVSATGEATFRITPLTAKQKRWPGINAVVKYSLLIIPDQGVVQLYPVEFVVGGKNMRKIPILAAFDRDRQTLSGLMQADGCAEFHVKKSEIPAAVAGRSSSSSTGYEKVDVASEDKLPVGPDKTQGWYGTFYCTTRYAQSPDGEVELTLSPGFPGTYKLKLVSSFGNSMRTGTSETVYVGEDMRGQPGLINFVVQKHVRVGGGQERHGNFQFDTSTGTAKFSAGKCREIRAIRTDPATPRLLPSKVSNSPGLFASAKTNRDRCEAVIQWVDRLNTEYPGRNFYRSKQEGDKWRKIKLFADNDFVPLFGLPFDAMSFSNRQAAFVKIKQCSRDPFTRDRMKTVQTAAFRVLKDNPDRQLGSDGYSSTVFAIRNIRELRNTISNTLAEAKQEPDFEAKLSILTAFQETISSRSHQLWPSEYETTLRLIEQEIRSSADARLTGEIAKIPPDAEQALIHIGNLEARQPDYFIHLTSNGLSVFKANVAARRQAALRTYMDTRLDVASHLPDTLAAAASLNVILSDEYLSAPGLKNENDVGHYFDDSKALQRTVEETRTALRAERDQRVSTYVRQNLLALEDLDASFASLEVLETKNRQIEEDLSEFAGVAASQAAKNALAEKRRAILEALTQTDVQVLIAHTPDKSGLLASAAWRSDFEQRYRSYWSTPSVQAADLRFWKEREKLLTKALPLFEEQLLTTAPSAVEGVLNEYLQLPEDRSYPIALEYELLAELAK